MTNQSEAKALPKFELSGEDWHEIYNCCDDEGVQSKIEVDGYGTTDDMAASLSEEDWIAVYLAVEEKHAQLKAGFYGRDRLARDWRDQMEELLGTLDPIRAKYIGGAK